MTRSLARWLPLVLMAGALAQTKDKTAAKEPKPQEGTILGTYVSGRETIEFLRGDQAKWGGYECGARIRSTKIWLYCADQIIEFDVRSDGALLGPKGSAFAGPFVKKK